PQGRGRAAAKSVSSFSKPRVGREADRGRAAAGSAAGQTGRPWMNRDTERRKQQLITMGKAKGYLTYDEINDQMPEDIVSADQIDDWLSTLGDEGIEIVGNAKVPASRAQKSEAQSKDDVEIEDEDKKEEGEEEEDLDGYSKTNDPVRMYLRKMGSVSLLTREGEVEIAKRIEEGERRVLQVVLNSSIAVEEILDLGERLKKQKIRIKEVVRDVDEDDEQFDEEWHTDRVVKIIEKVRRIHKDNEKLREGIDAKKAETGVKRKSKTAAKIEENKQEMFELLSELRLDKKQLEKIVE